jgi:hypothetical protein
MPMAAEVQITAAVVSPRTEILSLKITPAPIKPIPVMIFAEILSSAPAPCLDTIVKMVEPKEINIMVRKPADLLLYSLSKPIMPPQIMETSMAIISSTSTVKSILKYLFAFIKQSRCHSPL